MKFLKLFFDLLSDLLEATVNGCICEFFFLNLQLIYSVWWMARHFNYVTLDLTVKLNDKETFNIQLPIVIVLLYAAFTL